MPMSASCPRFVRMAALSAAALSCACLCITASPADPAAPGSLTPPITNLTAWQLTNSGATASVGAYGDGIRVDITAPGSAAWTAQLETPVDLKEGAKYVLTFKAKADPPRTMPISAGLTVPDYHLVGLTAQATLTQDWQTFTYTFQAKNLALGHTDVPQFQVGDQSGQVWISDVTLAAAPAPSDFDPALARLIPGPGEVKLIGTLRQIRPDVDRLYMTATSATDGGALPKPLSPPRSKIVEWPGSALLSVPGGRASAADAQPGDTVIATGRSGGSAQPLTARAIAIYPPGQPASGQPGTNP